MRITLSRRRKGQISIDYIAGALIFFGAIIVLMSSVLSTIPQFQNTHDVNELELTGWGLSEVVMSDTGYWRNISGNGTQWHTADDTDVEVVGLQTADNTGLSIDKIKALRDMDYSTLKDVFGMKRDFSVSFTEFVYIDTYRTFLSPALGSGSGGTGPVPSRIVEPSYPSNTSPELHYGVKRIDDSPYHVLLGDSAGWHNNLWVSDDWNFTDADTTYYNLSTVRVIPLDGETYTINVGDIQIGDGNVLILQTRIGRAGTVPPENAGNIIEMKRFGVADGSKENIIRAVFQVW